MSKCDFNKRASQLYAEITFRHLQEEICCIFSEHLLLRTAASESKLIKFWFVLSVFKQFWLVDGNRYFQCHGFGEVGVLDEVGGLTVREQSGVG